MNFIFRGKSVAVVCLFILCPLPTGLLRGQDWKQECQQLVAVITGGWENTQGRLCTLERVGEDWFAIGRPVDVVVGKNGLGWGFGLHSLNREGPTKKEGDKRAPAGVFWLESGFGTREMTLPKFDYRRTTDSDLWIDDPASEHYNKWVNREEVDADWSSAEVLRRPDGIYDYVIVVGHNRNPIVPGSGSAIFLHAWFGKGIPTIGCSAMKKSEVEALLRWLDRDKRPVLVQVPDQELDALNLPCTPAVIRSALEKSSVR